MKTTWSHLPNAEYIDWVLESTKIYPEKWIFAGKQRSIRPTDYALMWRDIKEIPWDAIRAITWPTHSNARMIGYYLDDLNQQLKDAAGPAIMALAAYDDCAYMIESEIVDLEILAKLGDQKAILLLPACIVFNEIMNRYK